MNPKNQEAYDAMLAQLPSLQARELLIAFTTDLTKHDLAALTKHADDSFVWFVFQAGTWIAWKTDVASDHSWWRALSDLSRKGDPVARFVWYGATLTEHDNEGLLRVARGWQQEALRAAVGG